MKSHITTLHVVALLVAGAPCFSACSASHAGGSDDDASVSIDASARRLDGGDGGSALPPRDASVDAMRTPPRLLDGSAPMPPDGVTACGGATCSPGELCCSLTSTCFDASRPGDCALPPGTTDPDACASNADCDAGEYCERADFEGATGVPVGACGGVPGRCLPERGPELCGGFPRGVCGCDGRTYPDPCAASRAGTRMSWDAPCGEAIGLGSHECDEDHLGCPRGAVCDVSLRTCVPLRPIIPCGLDSQCPESWSCCSVAGLCVPDDCVGCCAPLPAGTRVPCAVDADCESIDPRLGGPSHYCDGAGCGTPGGCRRRPSTCGGVLEPVCGCDGVDYTNECWAQEAGVRVASAGACP